jgi:hypothetical protein
VEVDKENVVEFLSHVGLKLERMLAYIQTKNKVIRDEEILMVIFCLMFLEKCVQ